MKGLIAAFCIFSIIGCAHVVKKETRQKVDKNINVEALFKDPDSYKGKTIIIGGVIINSANMRDGTYFEVLESPLDYLGRPKDADMSRGRFIFVKEGFLDTAIYAPGRQITIAGEVSGKELRKIGEMEYPYPLLKGNEVYLHMDIPKPDVWFSIGIRQSL